MPRAPRTKLKPWTYRDVPLDELDPRVCPQWKQIQRIMEHPKGAFVYRLTTPDNRQYYGKKVFFRKNGKPSNWRRYLSSSEEILKLDSEIKEKTLREILHFCPSHKSATYYENVELFARDVLSSPRSFWNRNIGGRFWPRDTLGVVSSDLIDLTVRPLEFCCLPDLQNGDSTRQPILCPSLVTEVGDGIQTKESTGSTCGPDSMREGHEGTRREEIQSHETEKRDSCLEEVWDQMVQSEDPLQQEMRFYCEQLL
jgi:hypothetical protein